MPELLNQLSNIDTNESVSKGQIVNEIKEYIEANNYTIVEMDDKRPWGAYFKLDNNEADIFVKEFFPELSSTEARLGNDKAELSPKILLVSPSQRLSWQYHNRRAEIWAFLNKGSYNKSLTDNEGEVQTADASDVVQFAATERHRLIGCVATYSLVAEIWQHTDSNNMSDEGDIVRIQDDYNRNS